MSDRKHIASDGSEHSSYAAAMWRSTRHFLFMTAYDGSPQTFGRRWDSATGKGAALSQANKEGRGE